MEAASVSPEAPFHFPITMYSRPSKLLNYVFMCGKSNFCPNAQNADHLKYLILCVVQMKYYCEVLLLTGSFGDAIEGIHRKGSE